MTEKMPKRDTTGECEGECRDRVKEGEEERQDKMKGENVEPSGESPSPPHAKKRDNPPGEMGGHV